MTRIAELDRHLSPEIVEARISEAGRERVFARARALGWVGNEPPLWVVNIIALEIMATRPSEQAVTEAMVNAAYNEGKSRSMTGMPNDFRAVVHAALKAAMEAGHD